MTHNDIPRPYVAAFTAEQMATLQAYSQKLKQQDAVNHPGHYGGEIEVIDFIEDKKLGFNLGNVVKYIARAGKKNPDTYLEDLEKAVWYLEREIWRSRRIPREEPTCDV